MAPIESIGTCLHERRIRRISVLTDNSGEAGRVFLETGKKTRAFGNVWVLKNTIIFNGLWLSFFNPFLAFSHLHNFSDLYGKLEGESIVGKDIQNTPNLCCFMEPRPSYASRSSPSSNRSSPSPTTFVTPMTCSAGFLLTDWREPIRQMLLSPDVNIRISTHPHINSTPSSPASCPHPQPGSSSVGSLPPISDLEPPLAESPPSSPAQTSPEPPLPFQPTAVPALHTSVLSRMPAHPSPEPTLPCKPTAIPASRSSTRVPSRLPAHPSPGPPRPFQPTAVPASSTRVPSRTPAVPSPELPIPYQPTAVPASRSSTRIPQRTRARPSPEPPSQPTVVRALSTRVSLPMPLPPQLPSVVLPLTGSATPAHLHRLE